MPSCEQNCISRISFQTDTHSLSKSYPERPFQFPCVHILGITSTILSPSSISLKYSGSFNAGCTGPKGTRFSGEYCIRPAEASLLSLVSSPSFSSSPFFSPLLKFHHLPYLFRVSFFSQRGRSLRWIIIREKQLSIHHRISLEYNTEKVLDFSFVE